MQFDTLFLSLVSGCAAASMEKKNNAGVAFAAKMKSEYSEGVDQRAAADEQRVVAAQQAVVKQLVNLKTHMKRAGHREERDGKIHVSYGALFEAVQGIMPTLSGTLKTARRLGIVAFEGETLFQGVSNGVDITLLDESDKSDYAVVVREKGKHGKETERDPFALDNQAKTITACARCGKPVMPADRVGVSDRVLHQSCFECHLDECNVHLTAARYASIVVEGQLRFYCVPHFKELFKRNANYTTGFLSDRSAEPDPHLEAHQPPNQ